MDVTELTRTLLNTTQAAANAAPLLVSGVLSAAVDSKGCDWSQPD